MLFTFQLLSTGLKSIRQSCVDGARVISGEHEGLFAWLAVNYASGAISSSHSDTLGRKAVTTTSPPGPALVGVLEMGGASTQITYQSILRIPDAFAVNVGIADVPSLQLFTHSFLSFGADEARRRVLLPQRNPDGQSPCLPPGFTSGGVLFLRISQAICCSRSFSPMYLLGHPEIYCCESSNNHSSQAHCIPKLFYLFEKLQH